MKGDYRTGLLTLLLLLMLALWLTIYNFHVHLPFSQWRQAVSQPDNQQISQMVFHFSLLPRLAMSLLVGAGLGLAGLLFQQVLRNPLAEPTTLGVSAGAQLGLTVATLWGGGLIAPSIAALLGALLLGALVFGVAWGKRLSPVTLILAGLVLSLYCGAVNQLIGLFYHERLQSVLLWGTGTLNQMDWQGVNSLWPRVVICFVLALLLRRPLMLMSLDDGVAKNLGLALSLVRIMTLTLAIVLSAQLVNAVGIIGFIALFAPLLAKLLGGRRLLSRMLLTPLIGAIILWLADQCVIWLTDNWRELSTGTLTAIIGAPLLLWLLPRLHSGMAPPPLDQHNSMMPERHALVRWAGVMLILLIIMLVVALSVGRGAQGWLWASGELWQQLLPWRFPRTLAALSAGAMLAVASCMVQRLTANPMASPEVLGISSGATFGVVVMLFLVPGDAFVWLFSAGSLGAAVTLFIILLVAARGEFSPTRMLLAGMGLSTAFSTLLVLFLASGDPRMAVLMTWIAGSTYSVTLSQALHTAAVALILIALAPLCRRWLMILPLGSVTARALGIALTPSRITILLLVAMLTAAATLTVGPLSFIGLMAPHMARMMGFRRTLPQLVIATLLGCGLMILADWCGRMVIFPAQVPAGLLATFIGAPYFVWLLRRS
ncbi:Fe3+-hydroxamate ABC transporter permease FhuB [Erwinia sp. OLTSP20]|uniref:Fe(3+)-hydroxamate ABC transporter permease FhuB n=1 Tax=unclassified Erwinia TaxID=2622719 RepID=UPI000C1861D8|nr:MULTISPECIES: Fe(3+)-hydroxamate ABC transporter permease FhuB [unclassified Erwinia]PIJ49804.1 Fe3+-hydroxamate ABC transporter permease FhuB [Erwinia sp. OAMSP11]PIJ70904.1 Fe3+-hydroxamate ABC transporter permease FhuB [Erwinia sp. OLSSP12]PIJ80269.1 Fe3+-hydroxamate ABC transporter permease FhuB [Erwinia sp. OLCASP19]PIJ82393.1 Fe3+-hydroxamate ABC transporter permease FhuB [Erwinia sp. OLMTSP26]PIJ85079.1 Fe3+-hydroxamate ABC transporter permease FhuB [Erwinia sp. OLMDSP33]